MSAVMDRRSRVMPVTDGLTLRRAGLADAPARFCEVAFADSAVDEIELAAHRGREGCALTAYRVSPRMPPEWGR